MFLTPQRHVKTSDLPLLESKLYPNSCNAQYVWMRATPCNGYLLIIFTSMSVVPLSNRFITILITNLATLEFVI